jgi:DNA modification methylase
MSDLEFVIYGRGKGAFFNNDEEISIKRKCKIFPIVNANNRNHPTEKPVKLMEEYIRLHSK